MMSKKIIRRGARGVGSALCFLSSAFVGLNALYSRGSGTNSGILGLLISAGLGAAGVVLATDVVARDKKSTSDLSGNKEGEQ